MHLAHCCVADSSTPSLYVEYSSGKVLRLRLALHPSAKVFDIIEV